MDCVGLEGLKNNYLIPNWPNIQNKIPTWHVRLVDLMLGPTPWPKWPRPRTPKYRKAPKYRGNNFYFLLF